MGTRPDGLEQIEMFNVTGSDYGVRTQHRCCLWQNLALARPARPTWEVSESLEEGRSRQTKQLVNPDNRRMIK
jgi:hypothetical protein